MGAECRVADLAGHHVDLVTAGHRDQHIGVFGAGTAQYFGMGSPAGHGLNVQAVAQLAQPGRVGVDHGDVERLAGQVLGERPAHLAAAQYQDLQEPFSIMAT